jgi:hypothetical membrane protein
MSLRQPPGRLATVRTLPLGAKIAAGVLLLIPMVALALVGTYAKAKPVLWGFPFFYWYQFLWVFLASGCTFGAYLIVERSRDGGAR